MKEEINKEIQNISAIKNIKNLKQLLNRFKKYIAYFKITLLLSVLWIFFSGNNDPLMICCGIFAIIFTVTISIYTNIISTDSYIVKVAFFKYVYILMRDVIISSIKMIKIVYSDKLNINPGTITMNVKRLTDQEKVLFANLITMTPGTFVIAINGDCFLIHALNKNDLEFKNNSEITALLKKMRGQNEQPVV